MKEELFRLLKGVNDTYDDFITGIWSMIYDNEKAIQKTIDYIKDNPEDNTSDIIKYVRSVW